MQAKHDRERYNSEVIRKKKKADKGGDGKTFKGSLCWLQESGAFKEDDIKRVLQIRNRRNEYVHELFKILSEGLSEDDALMIADLLKFLRRLNGWRFEHLELPVMGMSLPDGIIPSVVMGGDDATLMGLFRILFCNEGEEFKKALDSIR